MKRRQAPTSIALLSLLAWPCLLECAPLIGLDEDYYVAADSGGANNAGSAGSLSGNAGEPAAQGGSAGDDGAGAAGTGAAGNGGSVQGGEASGGSGSPGVVIPDGKFVFHRYTDYYSGDSEMFIVTFPGPSVGAELGVTYDLCNPLNGIFSPDGKQLAIAAQPRVEPCGPTDRDQLDVYLLDLENPPNKIQVTANTLAVPDEDPQFSPDGSFLVFKHNLHLAKWDLTGETFTNCPPPDGGFCFTAATTGSEQSKPVVTPDGQDVCYYELFGENADIYCFNLEEGLTGADLADIASPIVAHDSVSDARPYFSDSHLYYVRWQTKDIKIDQIVRRPLSNLLAVDDFPAFDTDQASDYSDPFNLGGDLVVFSSDIAGAGQRDLFVAEWESDEIHALDEIVPGINSPKIEVGASFWPAP
jgi:hypothetical protein